MSGHELDVEALESIADNFMSLSKDFLDVSKQSHHSFDGYLVAMDRFTMVAAEETLNAVNLGAFRAWPFTVSSKLFLGTKGNDPEVKKHSRPRSPVVPKDMDSTRLLTWWRQGVMPLTTLLAKDVNFGLPADYSFYGAAYCDLKIGEKNAVRRIASRSEPVEGVEFLNSMAKDYSIACKLLGFVISETVRILTPPKKNKAELKDTSPAPGQSGGGRSGEPGGDVAETPKYTNGMKTVELAAIFKISESTVLRRIKNGVIDAKRAGRKWRVRLKDLPVEQSTKIIKDLKSDS